MSYREGMIVDVELDPVKGSEQGKRRPCVIVKELSNLGLLIVIPLTSQEKKYHIHNVGIKKGEGGLDKDSFALCYQIRAISVKRVVKTRGNLSKKSFHKILMELKRMLGLG